MHVYTYIKTLEISKTHEHNYKKDKFNYMYIIFESHV